MRYGISLPNYDLYSDPRILVDLAREAEDAGWDGVFIWDAFGGGKEAAADPWIALGAIAQVTSRIRFGPYVTPLARRRPWKVAREAISLDHLSQGRMILPIGYGAITDPGFNKVGEDLSAKGRTERMDEGLRIIAGLMTGEEFSFRGTHFQVDAMTLTPKPVQQPRIPIWVDTFWPSERSVGRALAYDGLFANVRPKENGENPWITPDDIADLSLWIGQYRVAETPFDIIREGGTPGDDPNKAAEIVRPFAEAGVTWWVEEVWKHLYDGTLDTMRRRIQQGPPGVGRR